MNHDMPERPLDPPEATVPNEPDPDELRAYEIIDADILQVGLLSERLQLALNDYNSDNADIDSMALLIEECLIERQELGLGLTAISNKLAAMTKRLKQAY